MSKFGHVTGTKQERKGASAWYADIEAATLQAIEDYAIAQAREEAAMFRTHLAAERAALLQAQRDATAQDDAERTVTTALAHQVGNAVAAMPEAAERIRKAAKLVQSKSVWPLTDGSYLVGSQGTQDAYLVHRGPWTCECPDHTNRGVTCKHILAVQLTVKLGAQYTPSYN